MALAASRRCRGLAPLGRVWVTWGDAHPPAATPAVVAPTTRLSRLPRLAPRPIAPSVPTASAPPPDGVLLTAGATACGFTPATATALGPWTFATGGLSSIRSMPIAVSTDRAPRPIAASVSPAAWSLAAPPLGGLATAKENPLGSPISAERPNAMPMLAPMPPRPPMPPRSARPRPPMPFRPPRPPMPPMPPMPPIPPMPPMPPMLLMPPILAS